jgi:glycosyltransferase involved in cell wall biosynthesis
LKPVLFVTGHAPAYRVGALARLHEREGIELCLFGGSSTHGGPPYAGELPLPHRKAGPAEIARLAAGGGYRAVVCPTGGRLAPLAAWGGARRGNVPLILWASLWAHPRSAAHAVSYLPLRRLYRTADAVVTYGPHVSDYVLARGAHNVHVAPQSVDNDFWRDEDVPPADDLGRAGAAARFLFVGRPAPEKGLDVLLQAWRECALAPEQAELVVVGAGAHSPPAGVRSIPAADPSRMREIYEACEVLVIPSIPTRTFREPWALVANEAMNRGLAVIATDAVGAAAGGLVRDGRNGIVLPAGDTAALSRALTLLAGDGELRARMGAAGSQDVLAYSHEAWAAGFSGALEQLGLSARVGSFE